MKMDIHLIKKADIVLEDLEAGEGNSCKIQDVIAQPQGAPFTFGVFELEKSKGVEFDYDNDAACCYLLEGEIILTENISGEISKFEAGDIVYIPKKDGLVVTWATEKYAKFIFVTYPHWR
jgi:ethanolamine utilization protein EutQ (cupin superfamily)